MVAQLGINIISSRRDPPWSEQIRRMKLMRPTVLKVQTPTGFGSSTADVARALDEIPSIQTVILRGRDVQVDYNSTKEDLFGVRQDFDGPLGSWVELIKSRPNTEWIYEVGNEPEIAGGSIGPYKANALTSVRMLKPETAHLSNLKWTISMPIEFENVLALFTGGEYEELCDLIATHLYAHHDLDHPVPNWGSIFTWLQQNTTLPIHITEVGVHDPATPDDDKVRHYIDYMERAPARVKSLVLFGSVSDDAKWDDWKLTDSALQILGDRKDEPVAGIPIFGPENSTVELATAWAKERNAHQRFIDVIPIYFELAPLYNIPARNGIGQASKETNRGHYTGKVPASYHNWAGIKTKTASGDKPEDHQQFPSDRAGVEAHLQHLARYGGMQTLPPGRVMLDPRWEFVTQFTDTIEGLGGEGSWAPSPTYGIETAAIIKTIPTGSGPPMVAQIPGFTWHAADSKHFTPGRTAEIRGGAQHYTGGTNSLPWLTKTSGYNEDGSRSTEHDPVSATFLVKHHPTMEDRGWQLVGIEDTPWTTAFANPYTVSIEYEHVEGQAIPEIAYQVLAQTWLDVSAYVTAHGLGAIPIRRGNPGVEGHKFWVNNPSLICPDGVEIGKIVQLMTDRIDPDPLVISYPDNPAGVDVVYQRGFAGWLLKIGAVINPGDPRAGILAVAGFPLENERPTEFGAEQRCQKVTLHWIAAAKDTPWEIQSAILGQGVSGIDSAAVSERMAQIVTLAQQPFEPQDGGT